MRNHLFAAMAALTLAALPANVQAQDFDVKPYVGAGLGAFGLELKGTNGTVYSQKNTVFGGYVKLGADIGDYLGAELRVGATGSGTQSNPAGTMGSTVPFDGKIQATSLVSYLGKVQFPATPDLKLYALLGGTTAKFKFTATSTVGSGSSSGTKTGFTYGVGAEYSFQDTLSAGIEWVQYWTNVNAYLDGKVKIWGVTANAAYHF